jgi:hypothetical protein
MVQAVSCWPFTVEAQVYAQISPCGISGGQRGAGTGFCPSSLVVPSQYHHTEAPILIYHLEDEQ